MYASFLGHHPRQAPRLAGIYSSDVVSPPINVLVNHSISLAERSGMVTSSLPRRLYSRVKMHIGTVARISAGVSWDMHTDVRLEGPIYVKSEGRGNAPTTLWPALSGRS